eukprot:6731163-Alexandrium_andersonii.AAC.1
MTGHRLVVRCGDEPPSVAPASADGSGGAATVRSRATTLARRRKGRPRRSPRPSLPTPPGAPTPPMT